MKTEVVMKRPLFGMEVSQKSKSEMLSGTDLVKAGNKWRRANELGDFNLSQWLKSSGTTEFMNELESKYGTVLIKGRGRSAHTWMHPLLFIDCALAMSPRLKIETYEWLFDSLLKYRNDSGDSYTKMVGSLYNRWSDKKTFPKFIQQVARDIRKLCNTEDWQRADEAKLKVRYELQNEISLLCDVLQDPVLAVQIGFARVMKVEYVIPTISIDRK
ncbi:amidase [Vibrio phage D85]